MHCLLLYPKCPRDFYINLASRIWYSEEKDKAGLSNASAHKSLTSPTSTAASSLQVSWHHPWPCWTFLSAGTVLSLKPCTPVFLYPSDQNLHASRLLISWPSHSFFLDPIKIANLSHFCCYRNSCSFLPIPPTVHPLWGSAIRHRQSETR